MTMRQRSGLTLVEVLIAATIGVFVMGLAYQNLIDYFQFQQFLTLRTALRNDLQLALERISQKVRYANHIVTVGPNEVIVTIPIDDDHTGYLDNRDRYEVLGWEVAPDLNGNTLLRERSIVVPAFQMPQDTSQLPSVFDLAIGKARILAHSVTDVSVTKQVMDTSRFKTIPTTGHQLIIGPDGTDEEPDTCAWITFSVHLEGSRPVPRAKPVHLAITETLSPHSWPIEGVLPTFDDVITYESRSS